MSVLLPDSKIKLGSSQKRAFSDNLLLNHGKQVSI
jgi:hypothetical protein